jgi:hypothetical protein
MTSTGGARRAHRPEWRTRRRLRRAGCAVAVALAVLATGCGVDTQSEPETIPAGGLPSDLRPTGDTPAGP